MDKTQLNEGHRALASNLRCSGLLLCLKGRIDKGWVFFALY